MIMLLPRPDRVMTENARRFGCAVLTGAFDPWPLLTGATTVHAASGEEEVAVPARLAAVRVECHGHCPTRDRKAAEVGAALLMQGVRYADPFTWLDDRLFFRHR